MKNALWIALFLAWMAGGPTAAVAQSPLGDRLRSPQPGDRRDDKKAKDSPRVKDRAAATTARPAPWKSRADGQRTLSPGRRRREQGKWDDAITALTEAIQLDPKSAAAYSSRGLAHAMKDEFRRGAGRLGHGR